MYVTTLTAVITVFAISAISKIRNHTARRDWLNSLQSWGFPRPWRAPVGVAVVAADILAAVAACMSLVIGRSVSLIPALTLLAVYTIGLLLRRRHTAEPCHCFGTGSADGSVGFHIGTNIALVLIVLAGMINMWPSRTAGDTLVALVLGLVFTATAVFGPALAGQQRAAAPR
jgi:hypothetical protein